MGGRLRDHGPGVGQNPRRGSPQAALRHRRLPTHSAVGLAGGVRVAQLLHLAGQLLRRLLSPRQRVRGRFLCRHQRLRLLQLLDPDRLRRRVLLPPPRPPPPPAAGSTKRMADARMRGMKVVALDPRCSVAAAKADEWIPTLPGTDRAFVLGMAHVLVHELKRFDREFLRDRTNAPYLVKEDGYHLRDADGKAQVWDLRANVPAAWNAVPAEAMALEGSFGVNGTRVRTGFQVWKDILVDHTPERMAEITTVPAATIRRIAREFVEAAQIGATIELNGKTYPYRPAALNYYPGSQSHGNGLFDNLTYKLFNMLVGNLDIPGGHLGVPLGPRGFFISPGAEWRLQPEPP